MDTPPATTPPVTTQPVHVDEELIPQPGLPASGGNQGGETPVITVPDTGPSDVPEP